MKQRFIKWVLQKKGKARRRNCCVWERHADIFRDELKGKMQEITSCDMCRLYFAIKKKHEEYAELADREESWDKLYYEGFEVAYKDVEKIIKEMLIRAEHIKSRCTRGSAGKRGRE